MNKREGGKARAVEERKRRVGRWVEEEEKERKGNGEE